MITQAGIIILPVIKPYTECRVETTTNGDTIVTVYGDTTNCETYVLKGEQGEHLDNIKQIKQLEKLLEELK